MITTKNHHTLIDAICTSLTASLYPSEGMAVPAALLWTDENGQWESLIPLLQEVLPQLFVLGQYDPQARRGPVIWLKCIVDRAIPEVALQADLTPILYMPQVRRQELCAGEECRQELQPLIELQYRGTTWHQLNGRDWTVEAFLTSENGGLGLDVAQDGATRKALARTLLLVASEPMESLRERRLEAEDFDRLDVPDPVNSLLLWMSSPEVFKRCRDANRWENFKGVCKRKFRLDPDADDSIQLAADKLLHGEGAWNGVWHRFREVPRSYQGIPALLCQSTPRHLLVDPERQPKLNDESENTLRRELEALCSLPHVKACKQVIMLEKKHGERRSWVWAELGLSPYASALEPLARLAHFAQVPVGGASIEAMVSFYVTEAWRCDRAAYEALAILKEGKENALVKKVVRILYEPWLDMSARHFQSLISSHKIDPGSLVSATPAERDTCIVFVDGLRFDVAILLAEGLEEQHFRVIRTHRLAPIPTVTATAKPLATPVHMLCTMSNEAQDFTPTMKATGQPVTAQGLRDAMTQAGISVLDRDESQPKIGGDCGGWTEVGEIDELGHKIGVRVVWQIAAEVRKIIDRIDELLTSGWLRVRVVTDHGWLLLPGDLPKIELPPYVVESKWSRCAAVCGRSTLAIPTYPWYWNPLLRIASPPGISAFRVGNEYSHGGVSLQECVVPDLIVERRKEEVTAKIGDISWHGMRCRVRIDANVSGLYVDLRLRAKQPATSIVAASKELSETSGEVSMVVADDQQEGVAVLVVVMDNAGQVLDSKPTVVGDIV